MCCVSLVPCSRHAQTFRQGGIIQLFPIVDATTETLWFRPLCLPFACARDPVILDEDGTKRYQFSEGAVTIKEVITRSFWGIFNTSGLLAEFKIVGTWDAFPIKDLPLADVASESPPA